ncbi:uncharacterized protein LOC115066649 [Bactrocera dorsalis]|uniref:Uncharacterized protein LOC115066649 n=1 Tax=Bactrocera dorsalis TaxID=27457 RepID=A0A8N4L9B0_BACDO|nr:uncharacterized protein LOC115066649 [Bactrocera dorsalis]
MYRYHPSFTFHQHYFGVMPVYVIFIEPGRANRSLMTFMQQYRNRLQYRQRAALKQHDFKQEKQEKKHLAFQKTQEEEILRDYIQQKREWREELQNQAFLKTEEEEKFKQYIQQKLEWQEHQNLKKEKEETRLKLKEEQKQEMNTDLTCTWEIPKWDEKKSQKMALQTEILENELIDSLQNRHLEEEVRAKHMLQKRHLEERLKAKRELQTRHLEEQLKVMQSLRKQQMEEELREKRLLQERQLEEELKAKESLHMRHLEEEFRVKELILNRKRILRKQRCELKKQTLKQEQPQKLQEKQTKVQVGQDIEKLAKRQSQENSKREKLKQLLKQEIRKLKLEIELEKLKKANDSEEIQKNSIVHSKHSLSEADFAKHLRRHVIEAKLLRCHGYPVESVTHDGCVEIYQYQPDLIDLSESIKNNGVTANSSSSSFTVISETIDNNVDDLTITNKGDKDQNQTQLVEFGTIPLTEKHESPTMVSSSTNSSFSVISENNDNNVDDLAIANKDEKDQNHSLGAVVEFGSIPAPEKHKSSKMVSSSTNSSFSVISDTNDNNVDDLAIANKSDKDSNHTQLVEFAKVPTPVISDTNDNNVDRLMINERVQNCRKFDESLRKDCVRCGRPFYVNEFGEYLNRETCTYHWGKLHYAYKGKRGYIPQYTCCEGRKGSEGCARHPLHIWNGIVDGVNGPYNDFLRTRARCEKTGDAPKVYALQCKMCFTGRGLEVTKVMLMGYDGQLVYDQYVQPSTDIVDYWMYYADNSRTDKLESRSFKRLTDVQQDLIELIDADTILIGHCLEHELRVLRILHNNIVDIAIEFAHPLGLFPGRSLQNLAEIYLRCGTQGGSEGADSLDDMRICIELMKWRVREHKRQIGSNPIPELY